MTDERTSDMTDPPGADVGEEVGSGEEPTLEERLGRLDRIVSALEADDVELERALELFEEGVGHVRAAEKLLSEAELKVEELVGDEDALETRSLADEDE